MRTNIGFIFCVKQDDLFYYLRIFCTMRERGLTFAFFSSNHLPENIPEFEGVGGLLFRVINGSSEIDEDFNCRVSRIIIENFL